MLDRIFKLLLFIAFTYPIYASAEVYKWMDSNGNIQYSNVPPPSSAVNQPTHKERLVLMPLRLPEEINNLAGAMEIALIKGLQQKYEVLSGELIAKKAHDVFAKESRSAHQVCDETKCMQRIAEAFQSELIAIAIVTKHNQDYFLALSIRNIFDDTSVYSESFPCKDCDDAQVMQKLKLLSGAAETVPIRVDTTIFNQVKSKR